MKLSKYKNSLLLLIFIFINFISFTLYSNESSKQSNKFEIYNKQINNEYYIYIFTNYNSCSSCIKDLNTIIGNLKINKSFKMTLFLNGANNSIIEQYKLTYKDYLEIVSDPLGLYFREYKIESNNGFILLDSKGILLHKGDIYNLQNDSLELIINKNNNSTKSHLTMIKTIDLKSNNSIINTSRYINGLFSKNRNCYYIMDTKGFRLNTFDSLGAFIHEIIIPNYNKYTHIMCQGMSWIEDDKIMFIHLAGEKTSNFEFTNIYLSYNIENNTFTQIYLSELDSIDTPLFVYSSPYINGFISISNFRNEMKKNNLKTIKPLTFFDSNSDLKFYFGSVMDIYYQFDLRLAYMELLAFSDKHFYSLQAYSNKIQKFDLKGNFISILTFDFADSFREINTGLPINATMAEWSKFIRNSSMIRGFDYDITNNNFLTVIRNDEIPDEVQDPMSPLCKRNYYLNIFNEDGKLLSEDIILKEDFPSIIQYDSNKIGILHTTDNRLQITWYQFNL